MRFSLISTKSRLTTHNDWTQDMCASGKQCLTYTRLAASGCDLICSSLATWPVAAKTISLPIAAALEVLHTCLLIHDDIIDRDYVRHGRANVAGAYLNHYSHAKSKRAHHALSAALLGGDLAMSVAYQLVALPAHCLQTYKLRLSN